MHCQRLIIGGHKTRKEVTFQVFMWGRGICRYQKILVAGGSSDVVQVLKTVKNRSNR